MLVKKYIADTVNEAMKKVKYEMGDSAVILHTRKVKPSGLFAFFKKEQVEVTAAMDNRENVEESVQKKQFSEINKEKLNIKPKVIERATGTDSEVLKMMQKMMDEIETIKSPNSYPKSIQKIYTDLINNDVEPKIASRITSSILENTSFSGIKDQELLERETISLVQEYFHKVEPLQIEAQSKIAAFIGPTGVGKTTTIAKLAAHFAFVEKKSVGLVTADTYRIAAVEQLKTYGEIIGIPVDVVFTPKEMKSAIENNLNKDIILIDTAGRSHNNQLHMTELKIFLPEGKDIEIENILVLAATARTKDIRNILSTYCAEVKIDKLIFTKLDETNTYGPLLNVIADTKIPISYVTTGQNVPDDIELIVPSKLAQMVLKEKAL
ncbi:flagellar biosynthesis protein FlhF [Desulfitispora alkaliphila]|uniref:flagellar biosynthesis protein FlhF n=1 Tax=Desulfitispora alkaliphila TaxID=622674 RepID=UPI003D1A109E